MAGEANSIPAALLNRLEAMAKQHAEIAAKLNDPSVLGDHRAVRDLSIQKAALNETVEAYAKLRSLEAEAAEYLAAAKGADRDLAAMAAEELPRVEGARLSLLADLKGRLVNSDDARVGSVMLEVRAGTGGDEAALWARDILEMYQKYATRRGWSFEVLDTSAEAGAGGIRSATVNVKGPGVWTFMSFEAGVHSVKRVPATEQQGRVHTSTASVAVLAEPEAVEVKIDWANDVEEFATTSQGPGGQNVNKVATAVQIKHKPSGIIIRMMESKSQSQNRERARRLLAARLHELERQKKHAERSAARSAQIGGGERSEKVRTYRYKEGIVADERLAGEFQLRDLLAGDFSAIHGALVEKQTEERLKAM